MCGICGIVYADRTRPADGRVVERMCGAIAHRGPDDQGLCVCGPAALGARRLSIIDLAGGRQPIHNEDDSIWIVLNGEIYNYPELTRSLAGRGHRFYTHSDTEAILHAYEEFGDDCVQRLNGMFAFAVWDSKRGRLFAARDRLGIKPLYYARHDGALLFGSELKAILAYPGFERRVDPAALNEYLSFEYVPTPRSIFQGIQKLPPGHALEYADGHVRVWQYWDVDLARSEGRRPQPLAEAEAELLEMLRESVRKEMISDVPIGVLLSGGIDSSAVAALVAEAAPGRVQTFSIAFDDPSFDESRYARLAADHLKTEHRELKLTPERMIELVPRIPEFLDEPLGDSSIVPTYLVSQFTRQHVKVALGGDGGDELFGGYSTFQAHRLMDYYERIVPAFARARIAPLIAGRMPVSFDNISLDFKVKRFVAGGGFPPVERHHRWLGSFTPEQKRQLLRPEAQAVDHDTYEIAWAHLDRCNARELDNQLLYCDMKLYLEGGMLPKVDRASMANSLEVRVPLLNHTLVEYVAGLPREFKLRGLTTKYILRRALRGIVPAEILKRGKKGFNMPVAKWLIGPLRPLAEEMLSAPRLNKEGYFDPAYVRSLMDEHLAGRRDNRKLLWTLLMFELWHERWM